jgi:hypothetical protein
MFSMSRPVHSVLCYGPIYIRRNTYSYTAKRMGTLMRLAVQLAEMLGALAAVPMGSVDTMALLEGPGAPLLPYPGRAQR